MQPVGILDHLNDLLLTALQRLLNLRSRDDREGRSRLVLRPRQILPGGECNVHAEASSAGSAIIGVRTCGSAIATTISRGPSKASRLCAARMLSTRSRSPCAHASRTVLAS